MATVNQVLLLGALLGGISITGCSTGSDGTDTLHDTGADVGDGSSTEGSVDGPVGEAAMEASTMADAFDGNVGCNAANCGGTCCGDECILALDCTSCSAGKFFCPYSFTVPLSNGKCVSACNGCDTDQTVSAVGCFACGAGNTPAACAASVAICASTTAEGACTCTSSGDCPGATQVCALGDAASVGVCLSCGQPETDGLACTGGKTCNQASLSCK
jgi:hypothetical protein